MVKYCSIVPINFVDKQFCHASNHHLLLPHLFKYPEYVEKYKNKGSILLDNGFFEWKTGRLNKLPSLGELVKLARQVEAQHIVIPDVVYTRHNARQFNKMLTYNGSKIQQLGFKAAGVLTGQTLDCVKKCFSDLLFSNAVDMICIPSRLLCKSLGISRSKLLDVLENEFPIDKELHLFGLDSVEDIEGINRNYVRSIDSTLAWKSGYYKVKLPRSLDISRPDNYFQIYTIDKEQKEAIEHNILWVKDVLR